MIYENKTINLNFHCMIKLFIFINFNIFEIKINCLILQYPHNY